MYIGECIARRNAGINEGMNEIIIRQTIKCDMDNYI